MAAAHRCDSPPPPYSEIDLYPPTERTAPSRSLSSVSREYKSKCCMRDDRNQQINPFSARQDDFLSPTSRYVRIHAVICLEDEEDDAAYSYDIDREFGLSEHVDESIGRWFHRFAHDASDVLVGDFSFDRRGPKREFSIFREIRRSERQIYYEFVLNRESLKFSSFLSMVRTVWNSVCMPLLVHSSATTIAAETLHGYAGEYCTYPNGDRYIHFYGNVCSSSMRYAILSNGDVNIEKRARNCTIAKPLDIADATFAAMRRPFFRS